MAVTADELRIELGFTGSDWTADDDERAEQIISRARTRVRMIVGGGRFDAAVASGDEGKAAAIDEATLILAIMRFANPEAVLQRRQGPDASVSFADSNRAAAGLDQVKDVLTEAFGMRAWTVTL
jgi:hypothetical protein